jgi:hypothetical protein
VPLATALCKNLPAENTQRQLIKPKSTGVVELTEIIIIIMIIIIIIGAPNFESVHGCNRPSQGWFCPLLGLA